MNDEITLRDTFAAAALTGLLRKLRPGSVFDLTITARQAFELADAMLRERGDTPCTTLTDADREAVESAMDIAEAVGNPYLRNALRALLARHGGER